MTALGPRSGASGGRRRKLAFEEDKHNRMPGFPVNGQVAAFPKRQTHREVGTQSHGALEASRATERKTTTVMTVLPLRSARSAPVDPLVGSSAVLATDMPRGYASGRSPFRLLLISSLPTIAGGVRSHELGLAGTLSRAIGERTGHGVEVDVVTTSRTGVAEVERLLWNRDLARFDGLVLLLETPRSRAALSAARTGLRRVLLELAARLCPSASLTVVLAPRRESAAFLPRFHSDDMVTTFRHIVAAACNGVAGVEELRSDARADPRSQYRLWGLDLAASLSRRLREPDLWRPNVEQLDERARQAAVDGLPLAADEWEGEFTRLLSSAREAYGTRTAAISLIDEDKTHYLVRRGFHTREMPRSETLCHTALVSRNGLIVADARQDARFRTCMPVEAGTVGFYAGYRLENAEGYPVAVLCVFDPEPRPVHDQDLALLRDFAIIAERRLWELGQTARP